MEDLRGKIVFVTGGANGIGQGIVEYFSDAGARVCFIDVDDEKGRETQEAYQAQYFHVDVMDANAIESIMQSVCEDYGDIDIVINNVGIMKFTPITEISIEEFDQIIATNLRTVFVTSRFLARWRNNEQGRIRYGRIINIASTRYLQSEPNSEGYAASKGGVVSLTHALAISLSDYNITVNCISPGWIATRQFAQYSYEDELQHPSQRVGSPGDIARICAFLCAQDNDFINGQNIVVDGGMTKKMIYLE